LSLVAALGRDVPLIPLSFVFHFSKEADPFVKGSSGIKATIENKKGRAGKALPE